MCAENNKRPPVAIIIPARDLNTVTRACIRSIRKHVQYPYEIYLIDNSKSFTGCAGVKVIPGSSKWGFARSCNYGAELAGVADLLFLNNDTLALGDFLTPMAGLAGGGIGVVGALLTYPDGRLQHAGSKYNNGDPIHPYKGEHLSRVPDVLMTREVEAVTFACVYVTRGCWDALDGLDEDEFPFGYEDIDFCMRARAFGYKVYYCAEARLTHLEHTSQRKFLSQVSKKSSISIRNLRRRWGTS